MNFTFGRLSYFVIKDSNGNMTADLDRDIVAIRYNMLNLPDTVQFENGNRIVYFYYAGGERAGAVTTTYSTPISVPLDSVYLGEDPHFDMWEHRHGNLFYKMGSPSRLLFDDGFFELAERHGGLISQIPYVFVRDHLGSVRLVCNGNTGEVVQSLEYLPSGVIFRSRNFDRQPYRFTGKELLSAHGLDWYDSGACMQEFHIPRFTTMDPLCEKYYSISPYAYCNNNPVKYIDSDGRDVKPAGTAELIMIQNTLPKEARDYVRLDNNGLIDKTLLNSYGGKSLNFNNLRTMANSDRIVEVVLDDKFTYMGQDGKLGTATMSYNAFDPKYDLESDKDLKGETTGGLSTGESGFMGKTLFPDKDGMQNSPNGNIVVIVNKNLSPAGAAENYSHEANGHALLYILNGGDHKGASHQAELYKDGDGNKTLVEMIINSKKETIKNMQE